MKNFPKHNHNPNVTLPIIQRYFLLPEALILLSANMLVN